MTIDEMRRGSGDLPEPDADAERVELTEPEWLGPMVDDDEFDDVGTDQES